MLSTDGQAPTRRNLWTIFNTPPFAGQNISGKRRFSSSPLTLQGVQSVYYSYIYVKAFVGFVAWKAFFLEIEEGDEGEV